MMLTTAMRFIGATLLVLAPHRAQAHAGADFGGFLHGLMHPASGLDHVLAMIAVGLLAARLGGRALSWTPASFVLLMMFGAALGQYRIELPYVEAGVVLSVILFGSLIAAAGKLSSVAVIALAGAFAVFHGHAHGAEIGADASPAGYAAGFVVTTILLHVVGIGLASGLSRVSARGASCQRLLGAGIALAGCGMVAGAI